jgi:hypothetical protein
VGRLKVEAINPVLVTSGWRSLLWMIRGAAWELTCGFCRTRSRRMVSLLAGSVICPACGTENLLRSAASYRRKPE